MLKLHDCPCTQMTGLEETDWETVTGSVISNPENQKTVIVAGNPNVIYYDPKVIADQILKAIDG